MRLWSALNLGRDLACNYKPNYSFVELYSPFAMDMGSSRIPSEMSSLKIIDLVVKTEILLCWNENFIFPLLMAFEWFQSHLNPIAWWAELFSDAQLLGRGRIGKRASLLEKEATAKFRKGSWKGMPSNARRSMRFGDESARKMLRDLLQFAIKADSWLAVSKLPLIKGLYGRHCFLC